MPIQRFFSGANLQRFKNDFKFLVKMIDSTYGEYDLALRDNYFNLYYKGYSISKITPKQNDLYEVSIHHKFFDNTKADDPIFYQNRNREGAYWKITLQQNQLHPFFQKKHIQQFGANIKKQPSGEIGFEQSLITDNLNRQEIIIIDRQVTDDILRGKRMDLLALRQIEGNKYKFVILEVKLGNNKELEGQVALQLEYYVNHIKKYFKEYKDCYEKQYNQKKEIGLIQNPPYINIEIVSPVEGEILVGSYSGMAIPKIKHLRSLHPNLIITPFRNEL